MKIELTTEQENARSAFRSFANEEIAPHANRFDREERIPAGLLGKLAEKGYLGATLPEEFGGQGMDMITYGLLNEEIGRACSSVRSLLTVHCMVAHAVLRWGSKTQKQFWLPLLATGEAVAAFALTEPNVGTDAKGIETRAVEAGDFFILNGHKKWITFGQIADVFLVFAQCERKASAFLVERNTPGLSIKPISCMLGTRASMLAEINIEGCRIPKENLVGRVGFGIDAVASHALDLGRYTVAWGCVGIAQACLEACVRYTSERRQFGAYLKDYQLIQQMIADMVTGVKAARLLCLQAGCLKDAGDTRTFIDTFIAKYFASTMAMKVASDAVQIHGALGCSSECAAQRYFRDAKVMEIIEGSTQMQQITIARHAYQEYGAIAENGLVN
jgi:glutaryl-CoA dehydrogenase (non-decarboxylating)